MILNLQYKINPALAGVISSGKIVCFNFDAPTSLSFKNCTLCRHCIYVFCIYVRTKRDLCHLRMVFITDMKTVYSAVRTGSLNKSACAYVCKGLMHTQIIHPLSPSSIYIYKNFIQNDGEVSLGKRGPSKG